MSSFVDLADFGVEYARDQGASYSEARLIDGYKSVFIMQNGHIISGSESPWQGIGLRVLLNGGLSFVSVDKQFIFPHQIHDDGWIFDAGRGRKASPA